jgi:hypothetical protein
MTLPFVTEGVELMIYEVVVDMIIGCGAQIRDQALAE